MTKPSNPRCRGTDDPSVKPHPNRRPRNRSPFYALEIRPGEFSTVARLDANARGHVLNAHNSPVPDLYAARTDANSVFRGHYPGAGSSIGPAMIFAYIAALEVVAIVDSQDRDEA